MVESIRPTDPVSVQTDAQVADATKPQPGTKMNAATPIASMQQLHDEAPEIENMMLVAAASKIIKEVKAAEERRREIWREANSRNK